MCAWRETKAASGQSLPREWNVRRLVRRILHIHGSSLDTIRHVADTILAGRGTAPTREETEGIGGGKARKGLGGGGGGGGRGWDA